MYPIIAVQGGLSPVKLGVMQYAHTQPAALGMGPLIYRPVFAFNGHLKPRPEVKYLR